METGWLNLQQDQYAKLEDESQEGMALNLTERLGIHSQLQKQQQQQLQAHQTSQTPQANTAVVGTKRKRGSTAKERISKMPPCTAGKRSSIYRGVTRHRWTGRYEAHLWDKGTWNHTQNKKGKQVYLGAYDDEEAAARAYDLAALKYWGPGTLINFPVTDYSRDIEEMQNVSREEYLASLRRKSSGFSRGVSKYRGVARHHHNGRWEARIGRVFGNKYLYLGTYSTQEEAATAYDMAAIEYRGLNAVTNFDLSRYIRWLRPGGNSLPGQENNDQTGVSPKDSEASGVEFADEILQVDHSSKSSTDVNNGVSTRVWPAQTSEPYQLPTLGLARAAAQSNMQKKSDAPTALGILLQSNMFRQMLEKTSSGSGNNNMPTSTTSRSVGDELHESHRGGEAGNIDGSQYLLGGSHGVEGVYSHCPSGEAVGVHHGEAEGYTPFQHDFGLTTGQQHGEESEGGGGNGGGVGGEDVDGDGGAGLSLWSSFGSSFGTLPMTNAISTC